MYRLDTVLDGERMSNSEVNNEKLFITGDPGPFLWW